MIFCKIQFLTITEVEEQKRQGLVELGLCAFFGGVGRIVPTDRRIVTPHVLLGPAGEVMKSLVFEVLSPFYRFP